MKAIFSINVALCILTHISIVSLFWDLGKQCKPISDAAEHGADQGLHCLLAGNSIKNKIKIDNAPDTPKLGNGLVQLIGMEKSISHMWGKYSAF